MSLPALMLPVGAVYFAIKDFTINYCLLALAVTSGLKDSKAASLQGPAAWPGWAGPGPGPQARGLGTRNCKCQSRCHRDRDGARLPVRTVTARVARIQYGPGPGPTPDPGPGPADSDRPVILRLPTVTADPA